MLQRTWGFANACIPYCLNPLQKYEGARNEQGERHGQGRNVFPNKDIYVGEYANGKRNGKGRYFFKSNPDQIGKYEGDWVDGKKCGEGVMHYPDGATYEGLFCVSLCRHSANLPGKGHFMDGKRHGMGTYTYPNGDTYIGEWNAGRKHGKGVYNFKKENCQVCALHFFVPRSFLKYIGIWKDNHIIRGMWKHKDGVYYAGQFERSANFSSGVHDVADCRQRPNNQGKYVFMHNVQEGRFVETVKKEEVEVEPPSKQFTYPLLTGASPEKEGSRRGRRWRGSARARRGRTHYEDRLPHRLEAVGT